MITFENRNRNFRIIVIGSIILVFALIIALAIISSNYNEIADELDKEKRKTCLAPSCIESAANILSNMDPSIDPCHDFYKFSCGGFISNTFIPDDKAVASSFTKAHDKMYQQLRSILMQPPQPDEIKPFRLMKQFYSFCKNTTTVEEDGLEFIKVILESVGGWPVLEGKDWNDNKFDWKNSIFVLRYFGYEANYFLDIDIIKDFNNSSQRVISLDQAHLGLNREMLIKGFDDSAVQLYYNYMVEVAALFGADKSLAYDDLRESLNLEMELAKICISWDQRTYHYITISALQKMYPDTNWKTYIKYLLDIPDFQINDNETIILRTPMYLYGLEDILKATTKRAQANYVMWRAVSFSIPYLTAELRKQKLEFMRQVHGEQQLGPLWKECADETVQNFWKPISIMYERKHSNDESKQMITEMVAHIQNEFVKMIQNIDWMDQETKLFALEKVKSLPTNVGFIDEKDDNHLNEYYSTLNFTSENYLMAALAVSLFRINNRVKRLRKPVDDSEKAHFISPAFGIDVPLGIFQSTFFHNERPQYTNYGAVGSLIAHMITHVFDNQGRQWTEKTKTAYDEKTNCIVKQYSNYAIPELGINLDGRKTRDENVAENYGVKAAYLAYKSWAEIHGPELQLPGLNYTAQQLFWISYANMWCEKYRKKELKYFLQTTSFSPAYFGVIGSLANSEYFYQDFGCQLGSQMNPENKCVIW